MEKIQNNAQPGNSSIQIDRFDDHQFHEVDLVNISRTW
jgi:hypothetical protein